MSKIRFQHLLCIGSIGAKGENNLNLDDSICLEPEIKEYFYQKYKNKPGSVLFFNKTGALVIKKIEDLTVPEMRYFGVI